MKDRERRKERERDRREKEIVRERGKKAKERGREKVRGREKLRGKKRVCLPTQKEKYKILNNDSDEINKTRYFSTTLHLQSTPVDTGTGRSKNYLQSITNSESLFGT